MANESTHGPTNDGPVPDPTASGLPASFDLGIDVTAEDIANGVPGSPWNCPIALAINRALSHKFPDANLRADAGLWHAGLCKRDNTLRLYLSSEMPAPARDFILAYDNANRPALVPPTAVVQPFSFMLTFTSVFSINVDADVGIQE